jgi:2-C-methyl-D-erythritol 4-phosphate cytidylyltransferase
MKTSFLIPAGGQGARLGLGPKAMLVIDGKPLVRWLADKALRCADEVLIAAPADRLAEIAALCPECRCIEGGQSRQESIARLTDASAFPWLILHDVARPFASEALLRAVLDAAQGTGCAGAFLDPEVPVATLVDGRVERAYLRDEVGIFQAPQAFSRGILMEISAQARHHDWRTQSTIQLALHAGVEVRAVAGEKTNIKLTTLEDWTMAQHLSALLR